MDTRTCIIEILGIVIITTLAFLVGYYMGKIDGLEVTVSLGQQAPVIFR
jgi:hypothetical protein